MAEGAASGGAAQEPDRRGDRLRDESPGGAGSVPGGGVSLDRQQRGGARAARRGDRSEELAVRRERPRGPDGGGADQPDGDVQGAGRGAAGLSPRRTGPGQHAPAEPDRGAIAG